MRKYALIAVIQQLRDADLLLTVYFQAIISLNCPYAQHVNALSDEIVPIGTRRPESWQHAARLAPSELAGTGFWNSTKVTPLNKRMSHNAQFRESPGRKKSAKHATFTRTPEMSEIADEIQANLYPIPAKIENPDNYVPLNLDGLPGLTPKKRQVLDIASVIADDYLDESEKPDFIEFRIEHPVTPVYTDSYHTVKQHIPWTAQEGD